MVKAVAFTSVAAGVGSFAWGLALAFTLSLVMLTGLAMVATLPQGSLDLEKTAAKLRTFKGRSLELELKLRVASRRVVPDVTLDVIPEGPEVAVEKSADGFSMLMTSKFAGAFAGLRVRIGVVDPLGIFRRHEVRELPTVFEFLPSFLIAGKKPMMVSAAMLGDYPAGRSGYGQEFYSAEAYTSSHAMKDIMWKRLAKSPGESPMARVGEANIPEKITVALVEDAAASSRSNPSWMNLTSEAMARIGVSAISTGTALRVLHQLRGVSSVSEARTVPEVADLVMSLWLEGTPGRHVDEEPSQADIVVAGEQEMDNRDIRELVARKPTVMLSYGRGRHVAGPNIMTFTGREDISRLVVGVLSR